MTEINEYCKSLCKIYKKPQKIRKHVEIVVRDFIRENLNGFASTEDLWLEISASVIPQIAKIFQIPIDVENNDYISLTTSITIFILKYFKYDTNDIENL